MMGADLSQKVTNYRNMVASGQLVLMEMVFEKDLQKSVRFDPNPGVREFGGPESPSKHLFGVGRSNSSG